MCFLGAPLPQDDHALLACKCALSQQIALQQLNEQWPEEKRIAIRIGLNSGIYRRNMGSTGERPIHFPAITSTLDPVLKA